MLVNVKNIAFVQFEQLEEAETAVERVLRAVYSSARTRFSLCSQDVKSWKKRMRVKRRESCCAQSL